MLVALRKSIAASLVAILGTYSASFAQISSGSGQAYYESVQVYRLKAWTTMAMHEWRDVIYRFHDFQEGRIVLPGGFSPTHVLRLNFNLYQERVEYITEKGDTAVLEISDQIKSLNVGDLVFYNDPPKGYVEQMNHTPVALGAMHQLKIMVEPGTGERYSTTDWHLPIYRYDRLFVKKDSYYFIDITGKLYSGTWASIFKLFPDSKKEIKIYIKENKINFKVREDLLRLLDFCGQVKAEPGS